MAKRSKSAEINAGIKWDQYLSTCAFEEENWSPCVAWVVGRQTEDSNHIEALNVIVQTGIRRLFSVITKEQLYFDIHELGNPKNKKVKDIPPNFEVCEACKLFLDANEPIPPPLLAKLIKWKMMVLKDADIKRRGIDSKTSAEKKKGKDSSKDRPKSPRKSTKKSPEPQAKEGSKMKKRGEDDEEHKFIDDEPDDGAQFYIIVTGFHDPQLFQFLETINVKVNCVIGVSSQDNSVMMKQPVVVDEKTVNDRKEEQKQELKVFWRDLLPILQHQPDSSTLHDIARLDYEVSSLIVPTEPLDTEQRVHYSTAIFEDIATMIYNLLDAKRLYLTYLANMKLTHVPLISKKETVGSPRGVQSLTKSAINDKVSLPDVDMRHYNDLMNTIPLESVSVPLIMHSMLEQVVATEQKTDPPSEQAENLKADGHNSEFKAYLSKMTTKLGLSSEEHQMLSQVFDLPPACVEKVVPPDLINFNDEIYIRTHHLKPYYGFNAADVEKTMLKFTPFAMQCQKTHQPNLIELRQRAIRLQELLYYCNLESLTTSDTDHAFKQFVFECLDTTKCDRNGFPLQRVKEGVHQQPIPWDDPYPFFKIMIPVSQRSTLEDLTVIITAGEEHGGKNDEWLSQNLKTKSSANTISKPQHSKFGDSPHISDVIMELVVSLDEACIPAVEIPSKKTDLEVTASLSPTEIRRGILVDPGLTVASNSFSPRHSVSNSVRFDVPTTQLDLENLCDDVSVGLRVMHDSILDVSELQQRNLDTWCFAEHLKPHVLMQVLQEAAYHRPFTEYYQHKRDNSVMIVLHNPFNRERQNNVDWHKELHSNTGFRNYLENTAESIQVWLKKKEAEYQAQLLSKEVANIHKEEDDKLKTLDKTDKKVKRSPSRSTTSKTKSPRGSATNLTDKQISPPTNPYVRQGSIKAYQAEQLRLANEEEEKDKVKLDRRTRSAQKLKEKEKEKEKSGKQEKDIKSPQKNTEVSPSHSAHSQSNPKIDIEPEIPEPYWPFSGYDTGNQLIHMLGSTSTMFPSDGGIIKTERTEMVQDAVSIRSIVQKDGHVFAVHIINPQEDMNLPADYVAELQTMNRKSATVTNVKSEMEKPGNDEASTADIEIDTSAQKLNEEIDRAKMRVKTNRSVVSQFGSITAQLSDGMILALSQFGSSGESYLQPYQPSLYNSPTVADTQSNAAGPMTPTRSKTSISKTKGSVPVEPEKDRNEISTENTDVSKEKAEEHSIQDFQELFVTCPNGLTVKYYLQSSVGVEPESADDRHLIVRQSYPFKTKGTQNCENAQTKYIQTEISRIITEDGDVIKNMVDGSVEILSHDGTVSTFTGSWKSNSSGVPEAKLSDDASKIHKTATNNQRSKSDHQAEVMENSTFKTPTCWIITYPGGERIQIFLESGKVVELGTLPHCIACDPETHQTMVTRDDHVIIINYPNGESVVEHADGTRISSYYRIVAADEESSTGLDDASSQKSSMQSLQFVKVECPAYATVEFNTSTSENLTVFGNESSINVFPDGYYMFHHSKGGRIEIDTEGTMTYFARRSRFLDHQMPERELQYVMNHNADIIVETIDPHGNIFSVHSNGESVAIPSIGEDILSTRSQQSSLEVSNDANFYDHHAPRYFILHDDGSGTELLRYEDVAEYLLIAEHNPAAAVLKESLSGHPSCTTITIMKPYLSGISEKWLKKYDSDSIIPHGLRCRDLKTLPASEYKKPGPKFGTNVGKGLDIGTIVKGPAKIPILKCPDKLEYRQLLQFKPISNLIRKKLYSSLNEYANAVVTRMRAESLMATEDPRSNVEKISAVDLWYHRKLLNTETKEFQPDQVKTIYEQAVAPPPPTLPSVPPLKRNSKNWNQLLKEKEEEADAKEKIKNKLFEPYFGSELGKSYLQGSGNVELMYQGPKGGQLDNFDAKSEESNASSSHAGNHVYTQNVPHTQKQLYDSPSIIRMKKTETDVLSSAVQKQLYESPSTIRMEKTETDMLSLSSAAQKQLYESPSTIRMEKTETDMLSLSSAETFKPESTKLSFKTRNSVHQPSTKVGLSRHKRSAIPGAIVQKDKQGLQKTNVSLLQSLQSKIEYKKTGLYSSDLLGQERTTSQMLATDIYGNPRSCCDIYLPSATFGGKPGAHPNTKFDNIEDPVRRKTRTSSIAGATFEGTQQLKKMRGIICNPQSVNFGTLKEGYLYSYTVILTNTGFDACRFKVRQLPSTSGLQMKYTGGSVAAGMSVDLNLELYAIASELNEDSSTSFSHIIDIITETDYLEVPIFGNILSAADYDNLDVAPHLDRFSNARRVQRKKYLPSSRLKINQETVSGS